MIRILSFFPKRLMLIVFICTAATAASAMDNSFFAMDTGTRDAQHQTIQAQVELVKELGFDGIGPTYSTPDALREVLAQLDRLNMKIYPLYVHLNIDSDNAVSSQIKDAISQLKGRNAIIWLYVTSKKFKASDPAGDEKAVPIMQQIAELAEQSGVRIALYPHTFFWVERVDDAVRVAKKVDRKNFGVTFNLCHWLKVDGKDLEATIDLARPHLFVVTINGADSDGKDWSQLIKPLGSGSFVVEKLLSKLKQIGFAGPVGLQHFGIGGSARENLGRSIAAWRKMAWTENSLAFREFDREYRFSTGFLRGILREGGKSFGFTGVRTEPAGEKVSNFMGLFSHYRLLDAGARYGDAGWEWTSTAKLLADGTVEVQWKSDNVHPFDMTAVYRWSSSNTLDVVTTVVARRDLHNLEIFLASYFDGFPAVYGYGKDGFMEVTKELGDWLAFPRDDEAIKMIADGRWQRPPHPVTFKPVKQYAGALGMRRDEKTGLAGLVMAPPADCFAVMMPYTGEWHRSMYLSLFGRDFKDGERATARARLVISRELTDKQAIELYEKYVKELKP